MPAQEDICQSEMKAEPLSVCQSCFVLFTSATVENKHLYSEWNGTTGVKGLLCFLVSTVSWTLGPAVCWIFLPAEKTTLSQKNGYSGNCIGFTGLHC